MSQSDSSPLFGPVQQRRSTNSFAIDLSNMPSAPSIRLHKRTLSNSDRHEPPASQPLQIFLWFTKSKRRLLFFAGFVFMLYLTFSPRSISTGKYIPVRFSSQCSKPSDPSLPHLQYALMIDAGSTGSRIHVYRFNYCNSASPSLEHEIFEQVKPGLSSYAKNAVQAAESLKPLLEIAKDAVPDDMEHCTPLQVKATAGLRKLPGDQSQEILRAVKMLLRNQYPFPVVGGEVGVDVMDGANEGVFAWITVNYLLRTFEKKAPTAAIMDLGGASTQIVFEPVYDNGTKAHIEPSPQKHDLSFNGNKYSLYQHSYLNYGLKEAIKIAKSCLLPSSAGMPCHIPPSTSPSAAIINPCFAPNKVETFKASRTSQTEVTFNGPPRFTAETPSKCSTLVQKALFDKSSQVCVLKPCGFNGTYLPPLSTTLSKSPIYAFSYFYDLTEPFDIPETISVRELAVLQTHICNPQVESKYYGIVMKMLEENPDSCLELTYIVELLKSGYEISEDRKVTIMKKIDGYEMGWSLGSSIKMVDDFAVEGVCKA